MLTLAGTLSTSALAPDSGVVGYTTSLEAGALGAGGVGAGRATRAAFLAGPGLALGAVRETIMGGKVSTLLDAVWARARSFPGDRPINTSTLNTMHRTPIGIYPAALRLLTRRFGLDDPNAVSYTHLTLPTNREV